MAWASLLPYAAAAGRFAWKNRYGIMHAINSIHRSRTARRRNRQRNQAAYLLGYLRGRRRNPSTGRYTMSYVHRPRRQYSGRQMHRRGRYV